MLIQLYSVQTFSQDQSLADSLILELNHHPVPGDTVRLDLLSDISFSHNNPDSALYFANLIIDEAMAKQNQIWLYIGYYNQGSALRLLGRLEEALAAYFNSIEYATGDAERIGKSYMAVGDVYSITEAHENSVSYYNKAIEILRVVNDSTTLATALINAGDEYFNNKAYDSALLYFEESGIIFRNVNYLIGTAYNLGNLGMVYAELGEPMLAEQNINEAIIILQELEDYYGIAIYLTYMSDIYVDKGDTRAALNYAHRSLAIAERFGLKEQISVANLQLAVLYENEGELEQSYGHYKNHIAYRDSINNLQTVQSMADLRTDFEVSQKQIEVDLLSEQKRSQQILLIASVVTTVLIFILVVVLYRRYIFVRKTNVIIEAEKDRSETLLLNILPREIADELKENGEVKATRYDSVTVLFTDFQEFTRLAEHAQPEQLVKSIDYYFKAFDEITTKYGLEKIKTIGDSYMCAAGLPTITPTHAKTIIKAAKDMLAMVNATLQHQDDLIHFKIRIGVHTGPVVAGIVGIKKWQYDVWGDTVNIASNMETMSESGRINLSETTFNVIKDEFPCEYRGEIEVKNRGSLKMYFLS